MIQENSTQANSSKSNVKIKYIVCWRYNDVLHEDGFEFYHSALARLLQLEVFGQKATIHDCRCNEKTNT